MLDNLSDIRRVTFPDIEIKKTDAIAYGRRTAWRFSLYFDYRRAIDLDELSLKLGELKKEATFYASVAAADARIAQIDEDVDALVFTEGKTDWKHLVAAGRKIRVPFGLSFADEGYGATDLLQMCEHCARVPQTKPIVFLFDRDDQETMKALRARDTEARGYQDWGNNVFSMYIPIPPGRADETHSICIEFFYSDADITRQDQSGRRLLNTEFNQTTGADSSRGLVCRDLSVLKRKTACIVDSKVFELATEKSVALSKEAFAAAIYDWVPPFDAVDHSVFARIFTVIETIVRHSTHPQ
jgi:hypothetical protein